MNKKDISSKEQAKKWKNKLKEGTKNVPRRTRKYKKRTWCEQAVQDMLEELNLAFDIEKSLKFKNTWKHFDINLIDYPILIEVDGNYWHGNKETMREGKPNFMQLRNKQNDMIKNWLAKKEGYELIRIKEKELIGEYDTIKENLSQRVGKEKL